MGESALGSKLELGEGLIGQCAVDMAKIHLSKVPPDYLKISSGLGAAPPENILVLPVVFEGRVKGVLELASFARFSATHEAFLDQLTESIGIVINTIEANTRTEDLLKQSQSLAQELQSRQQELQQTNQELEEESRASCIPEAGGGTEEPGGGTGAQGTGGKGGAARAYVQVQVGIPRQHVALAPHTPQQPSHPLRSALQECRRQSDRQAGRICQDHPCLRQRFADAHQ